MDTLGPLKLVVVPLYNGHVGTSEIGPLIQWNLSIMDTLGPLNWSHNTVEPLYNGHVGTSELVLNTVEPLDL